MKPATFLFACLAFGCIILSMIPESGAHLSKSKKLRIAKKMAPLLFLLKKKYLFAVPFPLPIPIPVFKKTQPIIYKEKVAVPVPVAEPIAIPEPVYEAPAYQPEQAAYSSEQYNSYEPPRQEPY